MSEDLTDLYLTAFCGLVVPFPRLNAMRSQPHLITDFAEYKELTEREAEYYRKKLEAAERFFAAKGKP